MKKFISVCFCVVGLFRFSQTIRAVGPLEIRATIKDERMNVVATVKEERIDLKDKIATRVTEIKKYIGTRALLFKVPIASKSTDSIMVTTADGSTITITIDGNTQLRRRFWGKATLDEMNIGDQVSVVGKWQDEAKTKIQARFIRDWSIQKRHGIFFGTASSILSTGWVMTTMERGNQTVTVGSTTKYINRKGETIKQSDVVEGHRVRVKGLWNNQTNTITEVTQVKDFSIPVKPTVTSTATQ